MGSVRVIIAVLLLSALPQDVVANRFVCAGGVADGGMSLQEPAAKPAGQLHRGQRNALVLFASFADDVTWQDVPEWGAKLLDPSLPGSLSHFYDTMSFGALRVRGEVAPRVYHSRHAAFHYVSADPAKEGRFGEFCLEVLEAADAEVDFSRFDSDGPDGIPTSGDDDGLVDVLFIFNRQAQRYLAIADAEGGLEVGYLGAGAKWVNSSPFSEGSSLVYDDESIDYALIEFSVTPFDDLIRSDPEASAPSALVPGRIIGLNVSVPDFDDATGQLRSFLSLNGDRTAWRDASHLADALLLPFGVVPDCFGEDCAGDAGGGESAVGARAWGRIKASFGASERGY